jgi:cobalt-zinc-cadmium efflux system membrane fusion protein
MFITATFSSAKPVERLVVPTSAIVHLHDKDWVFVPVSGSQFRRVSVQVGPANDGYQQIISGLKPDDKVVTSALQFSSASEAQ